MSISNRLEYRSGFALFELLLAFSILAVTLVFALQLFSFNNQSVATTKVRGEWLDKELTLMKSLASTTFEAIIATSTASGTFSVSFPSPFSKEVTFDQVPLHKTFFDFSRKTEMNTCADHFSGDWSHPTILNSVPLSGSSTASALIVQRGLAYIGGNSPIKSDADLYIFNITDPSHMVLLSTLDTGPGVTDLALSWPYLYIANTSINGQLQVVDVSVPTNPVLKLTYKLPGNFKDNGYVGNRVALYKNLLALGTKKSDGPEFHLIDILNPISPVELSNFEFNTTVNDLSFDTANRVLVGTPLDEELTILDVSNRSLVARLGGFNAAGLSGSGNVIYNLGPTIYLGRTVGQQELQILDSIDPLAPVLTGSAVLKTSIEGMIIRDSLAFMATIDPAKQLQIWNVKNPALPVLKSTLTLSGRGMSIDCDGETLFEITSGIPSFYSIGHA